MQVSLRWVCGRPKYCEVLVNDNSKFRAPVATCTGTVLVSLPTSGNDRPQVSGTCEYRIRFAEKNFFYRFSGSEILQFTGAQGELILGVCLRNEQNACTERVPRQLLLRELGCSSDVQALQSGPYAS